MTASPISDTDILAQLFLLPIEDLFSIPGRGIVVTGRIQRETIKVGDEVYLVEFQNILRNICTGVEMTHEAMAEGQIQRGQVLASVRSIFPHTQFTVEVYLLTEDEGQRAAPFSQSLRVQVYMPTTDVSASI